MERIFHDVSLRAMYRKPLTSRARDAAHEFLNWEQSANVLFRLSSVSPAHHTPLGVRGGFLYKLGGVSYTIRILMYPACILHVSCMYPKGYMYPACILV
jgi:hypothetical protein